MPAKLGARNATRRNQNVLGESMSENRGLLVDQAKRCTKSRIECEYEYIPAIGRSTKKRTKPAPRPASELSKKAEGQSNSTTISELANIPDTSSSLTGLFEYPLIPSFDISLPIDTDWEAMLHPPATMPSLNPLAIRAVPTSSVIAQQPVAPPDLTSNQASLFHALFSLGETNSPQLSNSPPSHALAHPIPHIESEYYTPRSYELDLYSRRASIYDLRLDECKEVDDDPEGVKEIFCWIPLGLDRTVDSNSLPFVLQSFARWLPLILFDPLKIIHLAKKGIVQQFSQSLVLRSRLLLISELMGMLAKSWTLDDRGKRLFRLLSDEIWQNITDYRISSWPVSNEERERASIALENMIELISIQIATAPLSATLRLLQSAAPVFLSACPPPHPPHLCDILLETGINLKHFAAVDVATSITTGRPLLCRYHVPWSLELCDEYMKKKENPGLQWLLGIPDQYIMLFGYMNGIKEDADAVGILVDSSVIERIEEDMKRISILPCGGREPSLAIGRMVVQECWREAVFIYLYMALDRADAFDPRVEKAQKGFMRLVNGIKPGRNPDAFLVVPMLIAGVATTKLTHRRVIRSRILGLPDCALPDTAGNDSLRMLEDIWAQTELERRPARWEDLREACRRVTGI
ncbi:unnamed protein product [Rhizoctonia solani]|uniref:Fungal-specific transcription factor domain protein n=1 Tax=Rhizoctonia solani TaxID=456999 RepID=A0A8H3HAY3_9AGAM|nr:unnamed protein product [Rhizoctonia solani]